VTLHATFHPKKYVSRQRTLSIAEWQHEQLALEIACDVYFIDHIKYETNPVCKAKNGREIRQENPLFSYKGREDRNTEL
jgi:hypothetical protein